MKLDERKENILDFIIRDYIASAVPVSSGRIVEKGHFDWSPATMRNIMLELDECEFLEQPHTSAGRIPTEKGYRYFVEYLMNDKKPPRNVTKNIDAMFERLNKETEDLFDAVTKTIAQQIKLVAGICPLKNPEQIRLHGLADVLQKPEFFDHTATVEFASYIERLDKELAKIQKTDYPKISIDEFGMVSACFHNDEFGECVLFSMGPQRMNYEDARSIVKYTIERCIE